MIDFNPFTEKDFQRLIGWITSPNLLIQWAGPRLFTYPLTEDQLKTYLRYDQGDDTKTLIFTVVDEGTEAVGHVEMGAIDEKNGTASIRRLFVAPERRGRGICGEMVQRLLEMGFQRFHLRRIDLRVYGFNIPAISCYERAGLVQEGVLRKAQRVGDQYWDMVLMAVLREEWGGN